MRFLTLPILAVLLSATFYSAEAVVVSGSATIRVYGDNMKQSDSSARASALINALTNYFGRLQEDQPDQEIPEVTTEYFKFIKSYRITDRHYSNGSITYSVIADIDKVSLSDVAYMIKSVSSTAVYMLRGIGDNPDADVKVAAALKSGSFSTRYQQDFRSMLSPVADSDNALSNFQQTNAQYLFDVLVEPVTTGTKCTAALTAKIYTKDDKDYSPIKINGDGTGANDKACMANAVASGMSKIVTYARTNYVPLPTNARELSKIIITASNYSNFAAPKNLMEAMKKRTFITSYNVKGFAEKSLDIEVEMYISADMLLKKLQDVSKQYDFTATKEDDGNILLDFGGQQ